VNRLKQFLPQSKNPRITLAAQWTKNKTNGARQADAALVIEQANRCLHADLLEYSQPFSIHTAQ
jgi:hypothetical protein